MNRNAPSSTRPGRLRRFFAVLAERWSGRLNAADMPPRSPIEASHWEADRFAGELPEVSLPRGQSMPKADRPAARPLAETAGR